MNKLTLRFIAQENIDLFQIFIAENLTLPLRYDQHFDEGTLVAQMEFSTKTDRSKFLSAWSKRSTVVIP